MKKVKASELSNLRMTAGNEKKYSKVIIGDTLKEWVGIGWIDIGEVTKESKKKYPTVIFS